LRETGRKTWLAIFYLMIALGTLAKGPVAPALAGAIIVGFALMQRSETRATRLIAETLWIPGVLVFFAIALPWYVAVQLKTHQFFQVFILQHNLERFGTNLYRHQQPYWYYVPVFLLGVLPWTVYVLAAIVAALRGATGNQAAPKPGDRQWRAFLMLWIAVPLVVFTISQ